MSSQVCNVQHSFPPVLPGLEPENALFALPEEILSLITMELEFPSLVQLRTTCRALNRICQDHRVWQHIFKKSLGTTIPVPFFLSKPLPECSAEEVELALRRWEGGWEPVSQTTCLRRGVDMTELGCRLSFAISLQILPGGRWLLAAYQDGSIWYFDLGIDPKATSDIKPRLLLSCPFSLPLDHYDAIGVQISVDCSSFEALGSTQGSHHLQRFNLAVVLCPKYRYGIPTHVNIWRVHIVPDMSSGARLQLGNHLSSFTESTTGFLTGCSLDGPTVAYAFGFNPFKCAVIVDWGKANGMHKDQGIVRRYVPRLEFGALRLLPGNRLLTIEQDENIRIYDWLTDCPVSTLQPSEQQFDSITPLWFWKAPSKIKVIAVGAPIIIRESIRLILPTDTRVCGITIPIDLGSTERTKVRSVIKARFGYSRSLQAFGFHRGVSFTDPEHLATSQYRWKDETVAKATRPCVFASTYLTLEEQDMKYPARLLFDQFSNRVLATDGTTSRFFFLHGIDSSASAF